MLRFNRREPWSRFILTMGAADMVIGGVGHSTSLFLLGLTTAGVGLLVRWSRLKPRASFEQAAPKQLPPASASSQQTGSQQTGGQQAGGSPRERRIY